MLATNFSFPTDTNLESQCCLNKIKDEVCSFHFISFAEWLPSSILSVNASKHQLRVLPAAIPYSPIHQVPPPSRDNVTSANTGLIGHHLHLHTFGLGDVEILQIPSWFTEFATGLVPTTLEFWNLRTETSTMKHKLNSRLELVGSSGKPTGSASQLCQESGYELHL